MKSKYCYMCQHFQGSHPDDEDFENGEGMCPHTSVYTNVLDEVCGEEILFDEYK